MEIDFSRLPIPDWNIDCPHCRYPLRGLPSHRCPECGKDIDISSLIRTWTRLRDPRFTGNELPIPDYGLACRACGMALAGAPTLACAVCRAAFDPADWQPRQTWFQVDPLLHPGLATPMVEMVLENEHLPYIVVNERGLLETYMGSRSLGGRLLVASEFYFDFLALMRQTQHEVAASAQRAQRAAWRCPKCGEAVPGNFELCWNCENARSA